MLAAGIIKPVYQNYRYFALGVALVGCFFLWSWYVDFTVKGDGRFSVYNNAPIGYTEYDWAKAYSLNFLFGTLIMLFWFIHFEFMYKERVDPIRLSTLWISMIPITIVFLNRLVSNQISFSFNLFELVLFLSFLLIGIGGVCLISIKRVIYARLEFSNTEIKNILNIQLSLIVGILLAMFLFVLTEATRLFYNEFFQPEYQIRTIIHAPLIFLVFLTPLIFLYLRNPSFITSLSLPVYEVLIIDLKTGMTFYDFSLREGKHTDTDARLKSGLLSALSNMFTEIVGVDTYLKKVNLMDRQILLERLEYTQDVDGTPIQIDLLITLVIKRSTKFLIKTLDLYRRKIKTLLMNSNIISSKGFVITDKQVEKFNKLTHEIFN
jgi:hypothetical protein